MKTLKFILFQTGHILCLSMMIVISLFSLPQVVWAQSTGANVLFILDGSGSMWGRLDNVEKIVIAKKRMIEWVQDWENANMGLIVYGHRTKGDCDDIEILVPLGPGNQERIITQIQSINPKGKTPIQRSIALAAQHLETLEEETEIVLVSDGLETCDDDPCGYVQSLKDKGIKFTLDVVGFDVKDEEREQLECIANAGGGRYYSARNAMQLKEAFTEVKKEVVKKVEIPLTSPCDNPNRILNPQNEHCYQKFDIPMTWHQAKVYCEDLKGYLATLTSREERNFVYRNFKDKKNFLWLGGTDEVKEGSWKWITGERWTYTDWVEGTPDNCVDLVSPCKPENYLHIVFIDDEFWKGGRWNDTDDSDYEDWGMYGQHNNFPLCEWEK